MDGLTKYMITWGGLVNGLPVSGILPYESTSMNGAFQHSYNAIIRQHQSIILTEMTIVMDESYRFVKEDLT